MTGAPSKNSGLDLWPLNYLHIAALKRSPPTDSHGDHTRVPEACHVTEKLVGIYPELTPSKHSIHANLTSYQKHIIVSLATISQIIICLASAASA